MRNVLTREQFKDKFGSLSSEDIGNRATEINGIVIDEVKNTRYERKSWAVSGIAPLDMSGVEYLRPVAQVRCALDPSQPKGLGYSIRFGLQWFAD